MVKFQYCSDIHLNLRGLSNKSFTIEPVEGTDVLLLGGDIGDPFEPEYEEFLQSVSDKFDMIYVIAGNHEYYGYSIVETERKIREVCDLFDNVEFLQCEEAEYKGVRILGCTLWSNMNSRLMYKMNDYYAIYKSDKKSLVRPSDLLLIHKQHVSWLEEKLVPFNANDNNDNNANNNFNNNDNNNANNNDNRPVLVLTHHAPDMRMNGKYCGSELESAFATDLQKLFRPPVKCWINGHTHQNMKIDVNGIPCVSNCVGYSDEDIGYNERAAFTISV